MEIPLLVIISILIFGAGAVTNLALAVVGILMLSGCLAYISISTGWSHETTVAVIVTVVADLGTLAFFAEEKRAAKVLEEIKRASKEP